MPRLHLLEDLDSTVGQFMLLEHPLLFRSTTAVASFSTPSVLEIFPKKIFSRQLDIGQRLSRR